MRTIRDEVERPNEWLRRLSEDPLQYRQLLEDAGSVGRAAYRLARARCRTRPIAMNIPTRLELHAAAQELQSRVEGMPSLPSIEELVWDCESAGLVVIVPLGRAA
ncbi:MAG TPA: hypothetical protein PLJ27_07415 [Polyangiaceae bacterium]|jgi:hypothetical protein|nr:MAG: hypothetical protein BWY17_00937 [Deltaproteobacteria bacterium ADurb.Bin207]HNS95567.1 hypothetical protein [Polyangiaceae bacterium]HNZ21339.1 hypothetical protein [Polyangiaceae bacterium]HOD24781.1 hypothetical protein [Polyangiaceae bacterium]HOE47486.1 hypothetical protein [Polyangiaceae bacterium]